MVIRVVRATVDVAHADEVRPLGTQLLATYQSLPGFQGFQSGLDQQHARIISITTWETRAQAEAVRPAIEGLLRQYEALGVRFDGQEFYEVVGEPEVR